MFYVSESSYSTHFFPKKYQKALSNVLVLLLILLGSTGTIFSGVWSRVPTPECSWSLVVSPQEVHIQPPNCWAVINVEVVGDSCGNPIMIFAQYRGVSLGNIFIDKKVGEKPGLLPPYLTTVVLESAWTLGGEERELEVWALEEGPWVFAYPNPDEHHKLSIVRVVVDKTGVRECRRPLPTPTTRPPPTPTKPTPTPYTPTPTYTTPPPYDWWRWHWFWGWWGWLWPWTLQQPFDFNIDVEPKTQSIKASQSATYTVTVKLISGSSQPITLSTTGLPGGSTYTFTAQSGNPTFTSNLKISTETSTSTGTYQLTITGAGGGKIHSATVVLSIDVYKTASTLTVTATPSTLNPGEPVTVSGALAPAQATRIMLIYQRPDGFEMTKNIITTSTGTYVDTVKPDMPGMWSVKSSWQGDEKHFPTESSAANFYVQPQENPWPPIVALIIIAVIVIILALILIKRHRITSKKAGAAKISERYCAKCGSEIPEGSLYCMKCGEKV